jgi:hypothetical protein
LGRGEGKYLGGAVKGCGRAVKYGERMERSLGGSVRNGSGMTDVGVARNDGNEV